MSDYSFIRCPVTKEFSFNCFLASPVNRVLAFYEDFRVNRPQ